MADGNPQLVNDQNQFGFVRHPFRLSLTGVGVLFEGIVKLFMLPQLAVVPVLLLATGFSLLLPEAFRVVFVGLIGLGATAVAIHAARTYKTEAVYDKRTEQFRTGRWLLGSPLRRYAWDKSIFSGISTHENSIHLHALIDGFLVSRFMSFDNTDQAHRVIQWLSHYSGLPVLPERNIGPQHGMNDLRGNAWVLARLKNRQQSDHTRGEIKSARPVFDPADLPVLTPPPASSGGVFTVGFVYVLAAFCVAGFLFTLCGEVQRYRDLATIAAGHVMPEHATVTNIFHRNKHEIFGSYRRGPRSRTISQKWVSLKSASSPDFNYPWRPGMSMGTQIVFYEVDGRIRIPAYMSSWEGIAIMAVMLVFPGLVVFVLVRGRRKPGNGGEKY